MQVFLRAVLAAVFGLVVCVQAGHAASQAGVGFAVKRPVLGGSCKACPWGALGDIVKQAVQPYGWDIQMCYNCAGGTQEARIVSGAMRPPPAPKEVNAGQAALGLTLDATPPPPDGPVDIGITQNTFLQWAYHGTGDFKGEAPRTNIRLIANITTPYYLTVAVRTDLGVTDLAQLKAKRWPVKILWDDRLQPGVAKDVLAYYGITQADVEAAGGKILNSTTPADRRDFDVAVFVSDRSGAPEFVVGYEVTARFDLTYLTMPQPLLAKLVNDHDMRPMTMPMGYYRGVGQTIATVGWVGNSLYGRTDTPDAFAYAAAKALYEQQELLAFGLQQFAYVPQTVWKVGDVPLHPGAARYYREMGFMK